MATAQFSHGGGNWGSLDLSTGSLKLVDKDEKPILEIPFKEFGEATKTTAAVICDMKCNMDDLGDDDAQLCEMKLHPASTECEGGLATIASLINKKRKAGEEDSDIGALVTKFENVRLLAPKGIFTLELYARHIRLHGRPSAKSKTSYDWTISMKDLSGLFALNANQVDDGTKWICACMTRPLKVGAQSFPTFLMELDGVEVSEGSDIGVIDMGALTDEQKARKTKSGTEAMLQPQVTGDLTEVVPRILQGLSGAKIAAPIAGSEPIAVSDGRGKAGYLYFMEKSLLFVPSPPTSLKHAAIEKIEFEGVGSGSSTVQMAFKMSSGLVRFSGISKNDVPSLISYMKSKNLAVFGLESEQHEELSDLSEEEISHDDGSDISGIESDSSEEAPSKKRKKKDKKEKKEKKRAKTG